MTSPGVWDLSPAGYEAPAAMWTGTLVFPAGIDPDSTQSAVGVMGPAGGRIEIPGSAVGAPGPSPVLRNADLTQFPYGEAEAQADWIEVSPGGPGVAAVYDFVFYLPSGEPGDLEGFTLAAAADLATPMSNNTTPLWNAKQGVFTPTLLPIGAWYNQANIASTPTVAGQNRPVSYIQVPAQTFSWWPIVFATATITGTANTRVDLVARLNSQTGDEIARGPGQSGAVVGTNPSVAYLLPTFGGLRTSNAGVQVAAGSSATIYLNAEQQASTVDNYSTSSTLFSVGLAPIFS